MAQQPFRVPEAQQHFERASPKLIELEDKELERRGSDIEQTLIRPVDEQCDMFLTVVSCVRRKLCKS